MDYYDIVVPRVGSGKDPELICVAHLPRLPIEVIACSELTYRRAVERLAYFFKREFQWDFVQFDAKDKSNYKAFLWLSGNKGIGACCFRFREWEDYPHGWALQWIWLHPYVRRRGWLSKAWPMFKSKFPGFICEPPLSENMKAFLEMQGETWCSRIIDVDRHQ